MLQSEALRILKKHSTTTKSYRAVLSHSRKVAEVALELCNLIPRVDKKFVRTASILHDIGRFNCPPWKDSARHGIEGGRILRKEDLKKEAMVAERHLGGGITRDDIIRQKLPIPARDYMPVSKEEKIITIADKLVCGKKRISIRQAAERFKKEIGPRASRRIVALYKEVIGLGPGKTQRGTRKTCPESHSQRPILKLRHCGRNRQGSK
ncbi:MAG: HD domain-containing protein [Candidatus Woesearchaeota archaeon]